MQVLQCLRNRLQEMLLALEIASVTVRTQHLQSPQQYEMR